MLVSETEKPPESGFPCADTSGYILWIQSIGDPVAHRSDVSCSMRGNQCLSFIGSTRSRLYPVHSRKIGFTAYMAQTKGDIYAPVLLYEHNTRLSEAMYGVTQGVEIAFRNACHNVLSARTSNPAWYDMRVPIDLRDPNGPSRPLLDAGEERTVTDAKRKLESWGKPGTPARVVAELTFGFWVRLLAPQYEKRLWVPYLHRSFPGLHRPDRRAVFDRMESIRKFRNRIAHHEPIFKLPLAQQYDDIIAAMHWICPVTACWINTNNSFVRRGYDSTQAESRSTES